MMMVVRKQGASTMNVCLAHSCMEEHLLFSLLTRNATSLLTSEVRHGNIITVVDPLTFTSISASASTEANNHHLPSPIH